MRRDDFPAVRPPECIRPKNHLPIILYAYTVFVDTNNPLHEVMYGRSSNVEV